MEPGEIDLKLPPGAVHQGLAVRCRPFDGIDIADAAVRPEKPLVILDQVTDPQNVGAIFRSAAAFGIAGVVMQTRNAPALGGALAKAATGAIEKVDEIRAGMGFDSGFQMKGSNRDRVKGLGNAVTPPVGEWIAMRVKDILQ